MYIVNVPMYTCMYATIVIIAFNTHTLTEDTQIRPSSCVQVRNVSYMYVRIIAIPRTI